MPPQGLLEPETCGLITEAGILFSGAPCGCLFSVTHDWLTGLLASQSLTPVPLTTGSSLPLRYLEVQSGAFSVDEDDPRIQQLLPAAVVLRITAHGTEGQEELNRQ